jgi:pyruvate formate lyase activating enzyme
MTEHRSLSATDARSLPLARTLTGYVREARVYRRLSADKVQCLTCGHRCTIFNGFSGVCRVRFNNGGTLYAPWGYVGALAVDPVEKKPFFHAYPGAAALSFGMLGCDLRCPFCQNWHLSQVLRDADAAWLAEVAPITPEALTARALEAGATIIASTYNEPLITSEWAVALFRAGRAHGLVGAYVSNGSATPEVLDYLRPWVDLYKIDLKTMRPQGYRTLGGKLEPVLDTIRLAKARGFWVEVVTLVIPGFNDSAGELRDAARYV